jgi:hypothetical protein
MQAQTRRREQTTGNQPLGAHPPLAVPRMPLLAPTAGFCLEMEVLQWGAKTACLFAHPFRRQTFRSTG